MASGQRLVKLAPFAASPNVPTSDTTIVSVLERSGVFQQSGPEDWGSFPGSSAPVSPVLALVGFIGLCLLVGVVDGSMTARAIHTWYARLHAPPGTPPNWVFAPIWTALYLMIGTAAWLVWRRIGAARPLRLWGWQLAANALWAPFFFGLRSPALGDGRDGHLVISDRGDDPSVPASATRRSGLDAPLWCMVPLRRLSQRRFLAAQPWLIGTQLGRAVFAFVSWPASVRPIMCQVTASGPPSGRRRARQSDRALAAHRSSRHSLARDRGLALAVLAIEPGLGTAWCKVR